MARISATQVQQFVWKLVCRFGLPKTIVTNNGRQFIDKKLMAFYKELGINIITSSVEHPQTNDQAKPTNKIIVQELKKRLRGSQRRMGRWDWSGITGISLFPARFHWRVTLPFDIWDRWHAPDRGRRANSMKAVKWHEFERRIAEDWSGCVRRMKECSRDKKWSSEKIGCKKI